MNSLEIEKLIMTHISQWEGFVLSEWARPNKNFEPKTPIWYRASILPSTSKMVGMADNPITREIGICVIQVFATENTGTAKARAKADLIAKHLSYKRLGKLELLVASVQNVGEREGYYQLNINCNYRFN